MEKPTIPTTFPTPGHNDTSGKIILQGFGLNLLKVKLYQPGKPLTGEKEKQYNLTPFPDGFEQEDATSYFGTPVFSALQIQSGKYQTGPDTFVSYAGISVDTALFDVTMQKNIVKTDIQGRDGTVKEYISDGDYAISIRGVLVSQNPNVRPTEQMRALINLCKVKASLKITCQFLQLFEIYEIVIDNYSFPQVEGGLSQQLFQLDCLSDKPVELRLSGDIVPTSISTINAV